MKKEEKQLPVADANAEPPPKIETEIVIEETVQPVAPPKPTEQPLQIMPIMVNARGVVQAKDNSELLRYCGALIASAMVPKRFSNPTELFGALMFVRALNLPDVSIRQVAVIQGTPSLFGDLPLALVQKQGELANFKEQWFDKDYKPVCFENKNLDAEVIGAVCFASRGKSAETQSFSFTIEDARKAGLFPGSPSTPWAKYTKLMLRYKARSIMLKSLFADTINGLSIAEYDHDILGDENMRTVESTTGAANNEILEAFNKDQKGA